MEEINKNLYGSFGWKEFSETRKQLLDEYDRSINMNSSRPVQTEHGNTGEAEIRNWLENLLPKKYGVTSGYIIPDVITLDYKLLHYDVIIFDSLNSPVLWIDGNKDYSPQGRKRAIPAKHIKCVLEVKATFNNESSKASINKLCELNSIHEYFSSGFFSGVVFFELKNNHIDKGYLIKNFAPEHPPIHFFGGIILRTDINPKMTGLITRMQYKKDTEVKDVIDIPLASDVDNFDLFTENGNVVIPPGGGVLVNGSNDNTIHFSKVANGPRAYNEYYAITIGWSLNNFSIFTLQILNLLEGRAMNENDLVFGRVYDKVLSENPSKTKDQKH